MQGFISKSNALIFFCVASITAFSCSNEVPHITSQKVMVVFDFSAQSQESISSIQRLSVFIQDNDVERIKEIAIEYSPEKLSWKTEWPQRYSVLDGEWIGSSYFAMQGSHPFPIGEYSLQLTNYAGNTTSGAFSIEYPEAILSENMPINVEELTQKYPDLNRFYTSLYNSDNELVFFAEHKMSEIEIEDFVSSNPDTAFVQTYIESSAMSYSVLFPLEQLFP